MDKVSSFFKKALGFTGFSKSKIRVKDTNSETGIVSSIPYAKNYMKAKPKEIRRFKRSGSISHGTVWNIRHFGNFSPVKYPNGVIK